MKTKSLSLACFAVVTLTTTASALTMERQISLSYVREHPEEFSVSVAEGKEGLIDFTVTHHVVTRMYHVAHLAIYHRGKLIAKSDTPSFGKKGDNKFHFAIAAEDIAESEFSLSDSFLGGSADSPVPMPGTIINQFRLPDFVPEKLMKK